MPGLCSEHKKNHVFKVNVGVSRVVVTEECFQKLNYEEEHLFLFFFFCKDSARRRVAFTIIV